MSSKKGREPHTAPATLFTKPVLVSIERLKAHEEVDASYCERLKKTIESDKVLKKPIVADVNTYTILDGHHRVNALKSLGCRLVPAILVDYNSPAIKVDSWRKMSIDKETVISRAQNGERFPPKTTKHMIQVEGKLKHISCIQENVNIPLEMLK